MTRSFSNILALIDIPDGSGMRFTAAIEAANLFDCHLHIFYRITADARNKYAEGEDFPLGLTMMLENLYRPGLKSHLSLHIHIVPPTSKKMALSYVEKNNIDLLLTWNEYRSPLTFPLVLLRHRRLAKDMQCPVLLLSQHGRVRTPQNIILPVQQFLPAGKMIIAVRLARKFNARIHLVGVDDSNGQDKNEHFFTKACRLLRSNTNIDVECRLLDTPNIARATLKYGIKIGAEIILSCTGTSSLFALAKCLRLARTVHRTHHVAVMTVPNEKLSIQ